MGYTKTLKQHSKLSVPREDKPTQEGLLGNSVLETPQSEKKSLSKTRAMCWQEDKALRAMLFGM